MKDTIKLDELIMLLEGFREVHGNARVYFNSDILGTIYMNEHFVCYSDQLLTPRGEISSGVVIG